MQQNRSRLARFFARLRVPSPGPERELKSRDALAILRVMAGVCPIVAYRPKLGREEELLRLVRARVPTLRREGLATERAPVILRAKDGTIVEVSEWKSNEAIDAAHRNPAVLAMWNQFFEVCECVPLNSLAEAGEMFACFEPLED